MHDDLKMSDPRNLAKYIDHSCFTQSATALEIETLCSEAILYQFQSVCVNSQFVGLCAAKLRGQDIRVTSTVGFPLGACGRETKVAETKAAIKNGASGIEVVLGVGLLKSNSHNQVEKEISSVVHAAQGSQVKVIIESGLLTKEEIVLACKLSVSGGADFVKTSTGFSGSGASLDHIRLIKQSVGSKVGVTASGGIRTYTDAITFLQAGASSIGLRMGPKIITAQLRSSAFLRGDDAEI